MKSLIITCKTIKAEVNKAIEETGFEAPVIYLESGLHNFPENLHKVLQTELDRISNVDQVLMVMGYCGNAILGLKPEGFRVVVPKADDCLTMLLGSQKKRKEVQNDLPTYFLSKGWLDSLEAIEGTMYEDFNRTEKKYGRARAEKILRLTFKHYHRIGLIDTGTFELKGLLERAQIHADFLKLKCDVIPGTLNFITKFLTGPWDDDFLIFNSGETIALEHIFGNDEKTRR